MKQAATLLLLLIALSCSKKELPEGYEGTWISDLTEITVRVEPKAGQYEFITGKGLITVTIHEDKTADGEIGQATFSNAEIILPVFTSQTGGTHLRIKCGAIGQIFPADPLESKEVEIWMGPIEETCDSEMRYTENMADFPMASISFSKK